MSPDRGVWSGYPCRYELFGSMLLSGIVINSGRVGLASPLRLGHALQDATETPHSRPDLRPIEYEQPSATATIVA